MVDEYVTEVNVLSKENLALKQQLRRAEQAIQAGNVASSAPLGGAHLGSLHSASSLGIGVKEHAGIKGGDGASVGATAISADEGIAASPWYSFLCFHLSYSSYHRPYAIYTHL